MLEPHPSFETPESDQMIWRYLDASRFLALLTSSTLHFTRADRFEDKWEGEFSEITKKVVMAASPDGSLIKHAQQMKNSIFVNCWHESDIESAAMWKIYGEEGSNLAIVSKIDYVRRALEDNKDTAVYCGRVKYIDYSRDSIPFGNGFNPFLRKRKSFSFESEVRFIVWDIPKEVKESEVVTKWPPTSDYKVGGLPVKIDLGHLIHKILVSPKASNWYVETIKAITEKYGLSPDIVSRSIFEDGPLH